MTVAVIESGGQGRGLAGPGGAGHEDEPTRALQNRSGKGRRGPKRGQIAEGTGNMPQVEAKGAPGSVGMEPEELPAIGKRRVDLR